MADRPEGNPPSRGEYDGERDMDEFWANVKPRREPMQQAWFLPVILFLLAVSIPWYRKTGEIGSVAGGLPVWIWVAIGCSAVLAAVTAIMSVFFWDDDDEDTP